MSTLTFPQQLLKAMLTVCLLEECQTIRDVYKDIQQKHKKNPNLNYWFHPDFVVPLKTFVTWFKTKIPDGETITPIEAREVLDEVFGSD